MNRVFYPKEFGPHKDRKKNSDQDGNTHLGQTFSLSNSISRANAHMVYTGRKQHFTLPQHRLRIDCIEQARISYGNAFVAKFNP